MDTPAVTLIVPCYNEAGRLDATLRELAQWGDRHPQREVLFADDGSSDATGQLLDVACEKREQWRVVHLPHRGRGATVRGALETVKAPVAVVLDADLPVPLDDVERCIHPVSEGRADAAWGKRDHGTRPWLRAVIGRTWQTVVWTAGLPADADPQCGCKVFSRQAMAVIQQGKESAWGADLEAWFMLRQAGLSVRSVPVVYDNKEQTHVSIVHDSLAMLKAAWQLVNEYDPTRIDLLKRLVTIVLLYGLGMAVMTWHGGALRAALQPLAGSSAPWLLVSLFLLLFWLRGVFWWPSTPFFALAQLLWPGPWGFALSLGAVISWTFLARYAARWWTRDIPWPTEWGAGHILAIQLVPIIPFDTAIYAGSAACRNSWENMLVNGLGILPGLAFWWAAGTGQGGWALLVSAFLAFAAWWSRDNVTTLLSRLHGARLS